jgi:mannose-6-phosphate isomerase-like protein (cupin superfamily)
MQFVSKADRSRHQSSRGGAAYEYPLGDPQLDAAFFELDGRYPDEGRVTNEVSHELIYVITGQGRLVAGDREVALGAGDMALLLPGERYFVEGRMELLIPCHPAWNPEQHKRVDG